MAKKKGLNVDEEGRVVREFAPRRTRAEKRRAATDLEPLLQRLIERHDDGPGLDALPLSASLKKAIEDLGSIKKHNARARQLHYAGKLLRREDIEELAEALDAEGRAAIDRDIQLIELERWRERFLEEGDDAINDFLTHHPAADRQQLRALCRKARKDDSPASKRQLFKALRDAAGL